MITIQQTKLNNTTKLFFRLLNWKIKSCICLFFLFQILSNHANAQYIGGNGRGDMMFESPITALLSGNCVFNAGISPAGPINGCIGGQVKLTANTLSNNPSYQWQLNGNPIGGANQDYYMATVAGNYSVLIYETGGCPQISNVVVVAFNNAAPADPTIVTIGSLSNCGQGSVTLNASAPGSTELIWSNGSTNPSITINESGEYWVMATFGLGCQARSLPEIFTASSANNPGICMVTVDSATNNNLVVWEPDAVSDIDSVYIYRQSEVDSIYYKIGAVDYFDLSEFVDNTGNPNYQGYRYKIAMLDTCGGITQLSEPHRTINLHVFPHFDAFRFLSWNGYEGIDSIQYDVWRKYPGGSGVFLITLPANINAYVDTSSTSPNGIYWIETVFSTACVSLDRAARGKTKSNVGNNQALVVSSRELTNEYLPFANSKLIPNPSDGNTLLQWDSNEAENLQISVIDVLGKTHYSDNFSAQKGTNKINLMIHVAGVYFVNMVALDGKRSNLKMVVK